MDSPNEIISSMLTDDALTNINAENDFQKQKMKNLAGMNGKFIEYPFDTVKVRMQTMDSKVFNGTLDCLKQTWKNEGFKGFYRVSGFDFLHNKDIEKRIN
ncbi:Mitochondrial ornithine transporter 1 [Smittium culicis]|uniref:Mitochondrial ornithine transporter 1 n=1 Tax=Smittium culicis TaxID=133412 RepID=A0A1R1X2M2_9FUNG|nr:Mitochondrial ornithine transporter 1 [Smittium culicis]